MTVIYAVEAWILALMGWGWLSVQEVWAWSLLSAYVFYGLILLSSFNLVLTGLAPGNLGVRSGYFSAVLVLFLYTTCCVFDTFLSISMGTVKFEAPFSNQTGALCSFTRAQQLFFFSDSPFFMVQGGATLGYLVIQLLVAGAGMLDSEASSLWPGPTWSLGLGMLLSCRMIIVFDGTAKGVVGHARYVQLFSLPLVEFVTIFAYFMYFLGALLASEGLLFGGVEWRKGSRYVSFVGSVIFCIVLLAVLLPKGMLTPALLSLVLIMLAASVYSLIEAIRAPTVPPSSSGQDPPQFMPSAPPAYQIPYASPVAMGLGRQAIPPGRSRFYIPSAVEMAREKNKGV